MGAGRARSHKEVPKRLEELALAFLRQGERSAVMFLQQPQKVPPHAASAGGGSAGTASPVSTPRLEMYYERRRAEIEAALAHAVDAAVLVEARDPVRYIGEHLCSAPARGRVN